MLRKVFAKTQVLHALNYILASKSQSQTFSNKEKQINLNVVECVSLQDEIDILSTHWLKNKGAKVDSLLSLYKEANTNGDGTLDFNEFHELITKMILS